MPRTTSKLKPGPSEPIYDDDPNVEVGTAQHGVWCNCGRLVYRRLVQRGDGTVMASFNRNGTRHHCPPHHSAPEWNVPAPPVPNLSVQSQLDQLRAAQATPVPRRTVGQSYIVLRAWLEGLIPHCGEYRVLGRAAPD